MAFWTNLFGSVPTITVVELQNKMGEKPGPFLLDVRTTEEYRSGHIAGATSVPLQKLDERLDKLTKNREIYCICRTGSRSKTAARKLQEAGYTAVNVKGGMTAWQKEGMKVKAGKVK